MNFKTLVSKLNFTITLSKDDPEIHEKAHQTALGVSSRYISARNRTYAQIKEDCFYGTAREVGIARIGDGFVNHQEPDFIDFKRSTFGWDVSVDGFKLEIKPHSNKYFTVMKGVRDKLINNQNEYDAVVSVEVRDNKDSVEIIPRLIIPSEYIGSQYMKVSKFNPDQYYYDHFNGPCYELNKGV